MQDQDRTGAPPRSLRTKGRGATYNPHNRFAPLRHEAFDDGWWQDPEALEPRSVPTVTIVDDSKTIVSTNQSPDLPFDQSINPYRGCEHGCIYCYARPTHAYWDMSPGLDFETRIVVKPDAARLLEQTFDKPGYQCKVINIGANTDPYQPLERNLQTTRQILEVMQRYRHPFTIITKSALVVRDVDLLAEMAADNLCLVALSVTTLDDDLKRRLEPRTSSGRRRIRAIETLAARGIPVAAMVAPVIPAINDSELETILQQAREAGATRAGYILLRLPFEVKGLFEAWLETHFPDRREHVMSIVRQSRGGAAYQAEFGVRMRGEGVFATLLERRFQVAARRLGFPEMGTRPRALDSTRFRRKQQELF